MKINPTIVLFFLIMLGSVTSRAGIWPRAKAMTAAATEARNETAEPGFSRHVREARRVTTFLADALLLTTTQRHAVARCPWPSARPWPWLPPTPMPPGCNTNTS